MSSNMIIGIGGSGGAIASYMNTKIGIQLSQMNNSIAIIDTDPTHYSTHPPLFHITGMIFDSNENFTSFIQTVLQYPFPHEIIITTGFTGRERYSKPISDLPAVEPLDLPLQNIAPINPQFDFDGNQNAATAAELNQFLPLPLDGDGQQPLDTPQAVIFGNKFDSAIFYPVPSGS